MIVRRALVSVSAVAFATAAFAAAPEAKAKTAAKPPAKPAAAATSSIPGYTEADIKAALQAAYDKYKDIQEGKNADYIPALANILYYPTPSVFLGPEIQWGKRENFRDGFSSDDVRIQFSAKYNFKLSLGGK